METRDTGTQHKLRMPPELKEKLFASAKDMNRSLNAEIVARLEKSFEQDQPSNDRAFALAMNMLFSIIKSNKGVELELPPDIDNYIDELVKATNYKAQK
ncbi:Arc family DNA-binding protein [Acinetobacter junii]|uniref:Arc family DNA-binding protein n=1 Tax=Acinetobacter junii TaxID=40215 RepID=UPI00124FA2DA|nr:Arc family DNA-binding protein [Acinetobacter junii]